MTETVLMSPGGATEAKQGEQLTALALLAREATLTAVGMVLTQLRDTSHADLVALAQQLAGTLTVNTGLQQPTRPTDTQPVSAAALPLPAGAATAAKQLPDNHQVAVSNLPGTYPLPTAQVTALTPPAAITGFATAAKQLPDNHQVAVSNLPTTYPLPTTQVTALTPPAAITGFALDATVQAVRDRLPSTPLVQGLTRTQLDAALVRTADSGEIEYTPGLAGQVISASGDTTVFTPTAGKAWKLHWAYAVPVTRGAEDAPVVTIKTVTAAGAPLKTHYSAAAISKRKVITMPADARLVVNLDIAGRVPVTFDIEELP